MPPKPPKTPKGIEARPYRDPKKPGGWIWRYSVRYTDPVSGRRLREDCDTVRDALDFKAQLREAKRRGDVGALDRGRETLREFTDRWSTDWAEHELSPRTVQSYYLLYRKHIEPRLGYRQIRHITAGVVDAWKGDLQRDGVGAPTIRRTLAVLQSILRQAVVWGELTSNPVRDVQKPGGVRSKVITPLTVEQVEAILAWLDEFASPQDRMLAELLAYCAGRPQDVLALPWSHVQAQTLVYAYKNVNGEIVAGAKTGADKTRSVELLPTVRRDLLAYRMACGNPRPSELVVPRPDGRPWRDPHYRNWGRKKPRGKVLADGTRAGSPGPFARAAEAAGVPGITPYFLRHTSASLRLAEQRMSLQEIAAEMGHDVDVLSKTYAHVISEYRGQGPIDPEARIVAARAGRVPVVDAEAM